MTVSTALTRSVFPQSFRATKEPSKDAYGEAGRGEVTAYSLVAQSLAYEISRRRLPVHRGFLGVRVASTTRTGSRGRSPLPSGTDSFLGGHAVLALGYDDAKQQFILRNSWGINTQDKGYFYIPCAYATDPQLADDFGTVRMVDAM